LATAEFAFNNKIHIVTKLSLFKVNHRREPRIGFDIKKKGEECKGKRICKGDKE